MIVDCHTHWGDCYQQQDGADPTRWLEMLDRYGVTHALVMPHIGLTHAGRIPLDNDQVATVCARSNGRMIPCCTVHPHDRDEAVAELNRCLTELGYRAIKFHPWLQGFSINTVVMDEICEIAAHHHTPIIFHDGTPPYSLPSQMALLARRHPSTQIVLGHFGLFEHWREAMAAMAYADNVWGCLCSPYPAAMRQLVRRCDPARLVWGTDTGFSFADMMGYRLQLMDVLDLTDDDRHAIFEANPARLLGLTPDDMRED